jgi:RNA polymerase sigma factor (sigma-70 family)
MTYSAQNDKKANNGFTEVFLKYRPVLERLLRKFVGPDETEDLISETYLRTYESFGREEIAYPKTFLYKTARNLALNYISKHENRFCQSIEDNHSSDVYSVSDQVEIQIEAQEKLQIFNLAVESLSPKCRKAFIYKRVHGWSLKTIAKEMDISVSTVEKHVAKGVLICSRALKDNGYNMKGAASSKIDKRKRKIAL